MRGVLNWIGRFIAGCVGAVLGLAIGAIIGSWLILKILEWLAQVTG